MTEPNAPRIPARGYKKKIADLEAVLAYKNAVIAALKEVVEAEFEAHQLCGSIMTSFGRIIDAQGLELMGADTHLGRLKLLKQQIVFARARLAALESTGSGKEQTA